MAHFILHAEEGPLVAPSRDLLLQRVSEMDALMRLRDAGLLDAGAMGAGGALRGTAEALGQLASRPVESLVGLPAGALRFLGRTARRVGDQGARLGRRGIDAWEAPPSAPAQLRTESTDLPAIEAAPWWASAGGAAARLGKRWLGYFSARYQLSLQLDIDPYTRNPLLDAHLDRLAWASLVGGRSIGAALGQAGPAATSTLDVARRAQRTLWNVPPEAIQRWNRERLTALACAPEWRDRFLDNTQFNPVQQSQLADALRALAPQAGCDLLLHLAAEAGNEAEARYVIDALQLVVAAEPRFPVRFEAHGGLLLVRDGADRAWLPLPVDRLVWSEDTSAAFDATGAAPGPERTAIIGGDLQAEARDALLQRGWVVVEQAMGPARERQPAPTIPNGIR